MSANLIKIADAYSFPSNSPEVEIEVKRVDKIIDATPSHKVVVLKPIIDKVRLTFSGLDVIQHIQGLQAKEYWEGVYKLAYGLGKDGDNPAIHQCYVEGYHIGLWVALEGGAATFGFRPKDGKGPAVKLEFNPSKLTASSVAQLVSAWNDIEGGNIPLAAHLTSARATRCDVAIDLVNLWLPDVYVYCPDVWKIWMCMSMTGGVQTMNFYKSKKKQSPFLDPKGRSAVMVYDKRGERKDMGEAPEFGELSHTRVEFLLNKTALFKNLKKAKCPVKNWKFYIGIMENPPFEAGAWAQFLDSARFRGNDYATNLLGAADREALDAAYPDTQFANLVDESIWAHWPEAVSAGPLGQLVEMAQADAKALIQTTIFEP